MSAALYAAEPVGGGPAVDPLSGAALIERSLCELAQEEDRRAALPSDWDPALAELAPATRTRIPPLVEERCRNARHRANCGLIGALRHAWASADAFLHIWDYHQEDPQVLVVPADSAIVSVAFCPPRPGVFDSSVHLLAVLCTRLTVSLIGIHIPSGDELTRPLAAAPQAAPPLLGSMGPLGGAFGQARPEAPPLYGAPSLGFGAATSSERLPFGRGPLGGAAAGAPLGFGLLQQQQQQPGQGLLAALGAGTAAARLPARGGTLGVRLVSLEGYEARTEGAIFHCVSHTADGHILMSCGAPQLFELVYSRAPGWLYAKCRIVRHAAGLLTRLRDFLPTSRPASGRIRLVACAPHGGYVLTVDDANTIRLFGLRDPSAAQLAADGGGSPASLEELALVTAPEASNQLFALAKVHLAAPRNFTHVFPILGSDGHLRVRVVTAAGERLLFVCSATSPAGPPAPGSGAAGPTPGPPPPAAAPGAAGAPQRFYGFWLQHAAESRPGGGAALPAWQSGSGAWGLTPAAGASATAAGRRAPCLEEVREPCYYAAGVWVAASHRPGAASAEVGVTARVDDCSAGGGRGVRSMYTSLTLDSSVLDVAEEGDPGGAGAYGGAAALAALAAAAGGRGLPAPVRVGSDPFGAPAVDSALGGFGTSRSFALLLRGSVQVLRLSLKARVLSRPPTNAAECCAHMAQLALPPASGSGQRASPIATGGTLWSWTFEDAGVPSFEEQRRCLEVGQGVPLIHLGRWFCGLLRFLAVVLRNVWDRPLVTTLKGQSYAEFMRSPGGDSLCLALSEETVRQLLARLRPVIRFAVQQGLARPDRSGGPAVVPGGTPPAAPSGVVARSLLYTTERTAVQEGLAQVQQLLAGVLDVADRAQQILGLLSILHSQRNAYRVLQSAVVAGPPLESLMSKPLGSLVAAADDAAPAVQLCAAAVVEGGAATPAPEAVFDARSLPRSAGPSGTGRRPPARRSGPGAGGPSADGGRGMSAEVVRELEEQCPGLLARVDPCYVQALRLRRRAAPAAEEASASGLGGARAGRPGAAPY